MTFKVPYTVIVSIDPHPHADRLEIAWVYGFQVIVQKGVYKPGDKIIYVPIDSILPVDLEEKIFPPSSKIKLVHHRVRQIRIRGTASQGMIIGKQELDGWTNLGASCYKEEADLKDYLGITKYEPPAKGIQIASGKRSRNKKKDHPLFHRYNGVDNIKWFPNFFKEGEEVVIECKLHGTNARIGRLPFVARTLWQRVKKFFCLTPKWERVYGSNNVEISSKWIHNGFYDNDYYGKAADEHYHKIPENHVVYGEIIGPGIQKNYSYGLTEPRFVLFDVKRFNEDGSHVWLTPDEVENFAEIYNFEMVPILYKGPFSKEKAYELSKGPSVYSPSQPVREGCVIKSRFNYTDERGNKRALKMINESYLDDTSNSDDH